MNYLPWIIFTAAAGVLALGLLALFAALHFGRRRAAGRDAALRTHYLRVILEALTAGRGEPSGFPLLGRPGTRLLLVETLAGIGTVTCGLDPAPLKNTVARYGLDGWLLRRTRRSRGFRRARCLALLSRLPVGPDAAAAAARYLHSRNRCVRFYALAVQLSADPASALCRVEEYDRPFSPLELSEILALLRRGMLPVAYGPLLEASCRNLRRLGLEIVRVFGIEEAGEQLLRLVGQEEDPELGREALHTLCALRRPLRRREVAARIRRLNAAERRSLLRCMALEGYAPGALCPLLESGERPYYEALVQSYKRLLA